MVLHSRHSHHLSASRGLMIAQVSNLRRSPDVVNTSMANKRPRAPGFTPGLFELDRWLAVVKGSVTRWARARDQYSSSGHDH